ncbi:phospholipase C [Microbacterium sp. SORGH_AS428]|uniref:alkaline phosphatase family protein n=1 Tax=Microbacterium sp. SORGH_AS_0428 TaxID=3041788 RepID=UPI002858E9F8|nr:alkaline phosphatase family protein [Microbacterium sp. SORGH_AS_0428]MDR6198360.1 phospholipase C [Microbacterium sp. SORGH_AS_0428]
MSRRPRTDPHPDAAAASRRDFLRVGGLALGGLALGGAAGAGAAAVQASTRPSRSANEPAFAHVVVLMGENRSFDNLLGHLYTPATLPAGARFDGLAFGEYSNPAPDGRTVPAHIYTGSTDDIMCSPDPDPGETYPHVNTQIFGTVDPASNGTSWHRPLRAPWNAPSADSTPTMQGFVRDYVANYRRTSKGRDPSPADADVIMGGFSTSMLPVLSTLAQGFAVYDHWHCAVPSQTYCNRSFFHASTSHGFVTNRGGGGYSKWLDAAPSPTIFNRLEEAGRSWRIYFDEQQLVSLTGVMHAPVLEKYWRSDHFAYMDRFFADAKAGTLPDYAFIEPRMVYNHNDFHPPFGVVRESEVDGTPVFDSAVSDVRAGEALVASVYDAIRTSDSSDGSNALNTLLLITFDEHGGTYDHVVPPKATPPDPEAAEGEMGFRFDRLGVRVPAIAVSAYTKAGTVINEEIHHAAVIATLCRLHGLEPLTDRDRGAPTLFSATNLTEPRDPSTWPTVSPAYVPPLLEEDELEEIRTSDKPLTSPAKGLLGLLLERYGPSGAPEPETYADAYNILKAHGLGLFTTQGTSPSPTAS